MSRYEQAPGEQNDSSENDFDEPYAAAQPAKAAKPAKAADAEEEPVDEAGAADTMGNDGSAHVADPFSATSASKSHEVRPESDSFAPPSGSPIQLPNSSISGAGHPSAGQAGQGYSHSVPQTALPFDGSSRNIGTPASSFESAPQNAGMPAASFDAAPVTPYSSYVASSAPAGKEKSGIAALIVGIAAIVFCFAPIVGIILGIIAIVLAAKTLKQSGKNGKAVAGRICGIIGLALSALMLVAGIVFAVVGVSYLGSLDAFEQAVTEGSSSSSNGSSSNREDSSILNAKEEAAVQKVVEEKLDALANGDAAEMSSIAALADAGFYEQVELYLSDIGVDSEEYARWITENTTYDVDGVYVWDDGTATVYVDITTRDVFAFIDDFATRLDAFANSTEIDSISSDEELMAALGGLFRASMESSQGNYTNNYAMLTLTKKGSSWALDKDSWDSEIDYMFGLV